MKRDSNTTSSSDNNNQLSNPKTAISTDLAELSHKPNLSLTKAFGAVDTTALARATKKKKVTVDDAATAILELYRAITIYAFCKVIGEYKAGKFLLMIKALKSHGDFIPWVETTFGEYFGVRTAQRYMATCLQVDASMPRLRESLKQSRPELDIDSIDNEQILELVPDSVLAQISGSDEALSKAIPSPTQELPVLDPQFSACISSFLEPQLVLTTDKLLPHEIASPQIVIGNEKAMGLDDWPATVLLLMTSQRSSAYATSLLQAHQSGKLRECLMLLPLAALNSRANLQLLTLPQLVFISARALALDKYAKSAMTLLLLSDSDRVMDFSIAFQAFGFVKIQFGKKPGV